MAEQSEIKGWVTGRVPAEWYEEAPEVLVDRDEIVVIGRIKDLENTDGVDLVAARAGRVKQHREDTRDTRIRIAQEAQKKFERTLSWGARAGDYGKAGVHRRAGRVRADPSRLVRE